MAYLLLIVAVPALFLALSALFPLQMFERSDDGAGWASPWSRVLLVGAFNSLTAFAIVFAFLAVWDGILVRASFVGVLSETFVKTLQFSGHLGFGGLASGVAAESTGRAGATWAALASGFAFVACFSMSLMGSSLGFY